MKRVSLKDMISYDEHELIKKDFKNGRIKKLEPLWHFSKSCIDFSLQGDKLDESLLSLGYSILNIDIESLLDTFDPDLAELYREKNLYNDLQEGSKISGVIDKWTKGILLIPPTIFYQDSQIFKHVKNPDVLFPQDGKHRLNVAYYFGAQEIPIIVINKQLDKILDILQINI